MLQKRGKDKDKDKLTKTQTRKKRMIINQLPQVGIQLLYNPPVYLTVAILKYGLSCTKRKFCFQSVNVKYVK